MFSKKLVATLAVLAATALATAANADVAADADDGQETDPFRRPALTLSFVDGRLFAQEAERRTERRQDADA